MLHLIDKLRLKEIKFSDINKKVKKFLWLITSYKQIYARFYSFLALHQDLLLQETLTVSGVCLTVSISIDGALVEGHDVLSEGSGLVAENIFHLTQLFIQRRTPSLCCCVTTTTEHPPVPVNKITVAQPNYFHTEQEGRKKGGKKFLTLSIVPKHETKCLTSAFELTGKLSMVYLLDGPQKQRTVSYFMHNNHCGPLFLLHM